jgi:hypothetical protein
MLFKSFALFLFQVVDSSFLLKRLKVQRSWKVFLFFLNKLFITSNFFILRRLLSELRHRDCNAILPWTSKGM